MNETVFCVEDLTVAYTLSDGRKNVVVWRARLDLKRGSILGLAGESGCGKSTTALAAIGYRSPGLRILEGNAYLGRLDLLRLPTSELRSIWGRQVAYVAQNATTALNPAIPIGRQLAQPLITHLGLGAEALRRRQLELLETVGIPDPPTALRRYPYQFSGGQQQRIAIAIALSCGPEVLLFDEPTTGLDVTTQARISELLRSLVRETGVAALCVSHDLPLLANISDQLAVMYAGEIVERGAAADVARRPRHPYTQALIAAVPSTHTGCAGIGIPGRLPVSVVLDACSFAPRCPHALEACRAGHPDLRALEPDHAARCLRVEEIVRQLPEVSRLPSVPASRERLLEVEELWCAYARAPTPAVKGISFVVAGAETLGVVGESGSGKSTVLRAVIGLHPPSSGTIRLSGRELAPTAVKRPRSVRRELQIVFQNPDSSLNPRHTVLDIVRRPIRLFRDDVTRAGERHTVLELLEAVKLPGAVLHRYPSELSGGQKQRVAIARAFAARPSLLLCDEVTSALDASVQATIIELVAELSVEFGTAVIFVSHDLAVVRTIATRVIVMKEGEVCEEGETGELFVEPRHPYTRELLAATPEIEARPIQTPLNAIT